MSGGPYWSSREEAILQARLAEGKSAKAIAYELGRPANTIYHRLTRLRATNPDMPRLVRTFKNRIWTPEQDEIVRRWCRGELGAVEARDTLHCHHYYMQRRAVELGLELPVRKSKYRKRSRLVQVESPASVPAPKPDYDGANFSCTVGHDDPLLSALRAAHPERMPA